jgi:hypothetical protein
MVFQKKCFRQQYLEKEGVHKTFKTLFKMVIDKGFVSLKSLEKGTEEAIIIQKIFCIQ